ncbi:MAG: phytanoyl-CoA dioxygenase family protein [Gammaproteobacteria bacterium]|nr:phytanoyl-CoA dioxygenase family protein [Gammaproteobacteria bacterium]
MTDAARQPGEIEHRDPRSRRACFDHLGVVRIRGVIPEARVAAARDRVQGALAAEGLVSDGTWVGPLYDVLDPATVQMDDVRALTAAAKAVRKRSRGGALHALFGEEVTAAARELVSGRALEPSPPMAQLLFTPPGARSWTVPGRVWHVDLPRLASGGSPGIQAFTFLEPVRAGEGGTLVVAGSHRLLNDSPRGSKEIKRALRREPWFRELMSGRNASVTGRDRRTFLTEAGIVDGVPVRVVELTGESGDVCFTDLRLLHTLAPNPSPRPRLMATQRFTFSDVAEDLRSAS